MSIQGMRRRHFIWNSSCHHIFRVDKLLLDNFLFFSISTAAVRPPKHHSPDTETDYGTTAESMCFLGYNDFQRQLTLLTRTNRWCRRILFLTQNTHALKKHDSCSATFSSSWIRILPLQSMLVSPSEVIFYLARRKLWLIHHVKVLSFTSEHRAHWSSVACISLPPATELSQDSGVLMCSVQAITMTTCKYRKKQ